MPNTNSLSVVGASSQYLSVNNNAGITGGNISMEAWVKIPSAISANQYVFVYQTSGSTPYVGYYIDYQYNGGTPRLRFGRLREGVALTTVDYTITLTTDTWYHVALTYDGTNVRGYVNGSLVGSPTAASGDGSAAYNDQKIMIGVRWDGAGNVPVSTDYATALIDDVRIWNDVRTVTEISDNKDTELVGNEANLVAYWKLNNSLLDETSNNNDLTNNNSAIFSTDVPFTGVTTNSNFFLLL